MSLIDPFGTISEWVIANLDKVLFSVLSAVVGYVVYRVVSREIGRLKDQRRLEEGLAYTLTRISKWVFLLIILSIVLMQFKITLGFITGLLTLLGGTIIGFAAINTIGNAIAGFIVMTSRPLWVGDRIYFKDQFADVVEIGLIYTKMQTLDNVSVSIPNQELLKAEIINYGKDHIVRRQVTVTGGYDLDHRDVEKALLEAAGKVPRVLKEPRPYIRITNFQNYAIEYTLYAFINNVKALPEIDAELNIAVLEACNKYNIDLSTPTLYRQIQD